MSNAAFAVRHMDGRWWDGKYWWYDEKMARHFTREPDPWGDANREADRLRAAGEACHVAYLRLDGTSQTRVAPPRKRKVAK